ncbi:equilibrative nucleoside transporter 1-like [Liolophura sinensis]|uniref:equilibrative nucleoside transporter 1-like n=1 Tax=Liolophura sinensis TaxID=3198878 RepID=UPI0031586BE8
MSSPAEEDYPMSTFGKRKKVANSEHLNTSNSIPSHSTPISKNHSERGTAEETVEFLSPVSKASGWESNNHSDDVLNFTNSEHDRQFPKHPPKDRWRLVQMIMLVYGLASLMPWNMFITAKSYFDFKLTTNESSCSEYRQQFLNYLGICSNIPMILLSFLNMVCHCGGGQSSKRIIWSLLTVVAVFILTVVLAMIDSSDWPGTFFLITMASVVVLNMANGVFQNCVYGLAAILPMKYTNAVVLGTNTSGVFTAVINIIAMWASPSTRTAAIYYFITAIFVLLVAFDSYFALPLLKYYKYYQRVVEMKREETRQTQGTTRPPYLLIFKKIWVQLFSVAFIFFVTLSIFPAIQAQVRRIDFPLSDDYWVAVFCFLSFNVFAFLGNLMSEWIKFPGPRFLWLPVLIRGLFFIPFFVLSNYRPEVRIVENIPMWLANDYVYIVGSVIFAFTSGYYSSLAMMYGPSLVESHHAPTAGMMMAFALIVGLFLGVNFSLGIVKFVQLVAERPAEASGC